MKTLYKYPTSCVSLAPAFPNPPVKSKTREREKLKEQKGPVIRSSEKIGTYEKDIKGITVLSKVKTYTKIKTLLSHLVAKSVDAGPSAQSVWDLSVKEEN